MQACPQNNKPQSKIYDFKDMRTGIEMQIDPLQAIIIVILKKIWLKTPESSEACGE